MAPPSVTLARSAASATASRYVCALSPVRKSLTKGLCTKGL
ncbi:Uncharacterised protein [Mycobacteroides abscessus subsp. abscessus]|nr:Uncharacterised protein [Mycobacteroides abscessus subsp. abscessus]